MNKQELMQLIEERVLDNPNLIPHTWGIFLNRYGYIQKYNDKTCPLGMFIVGTYPNDKDWQRYGEKSQVSKVLGGLGWQDIDDFIAGWDGSYSYPGSDINKYSLRDSWYDFGFTLGAQYQAKYPYQRKLDKSRINV